MKNVLLLVHDDAGQEARLQAALGIVRAVEGHLTCLDVIIYPMISADYEASPPVTFSSRNRPTITPNTLDRERIWKANDPATGGRPGRGRR
jgi:hypothetical protein